MSAIIITAIVLFTSSACSRNIRNDYDMDEVVSQEGASGAFASHSNETLRISTHAMNEPILVQAAEALGVNIRFTSTSSEKKKAITI